MANPNDPIARYTESFLYLQNALDKVAGVIQESIDVLGDSQKVSNALGRTFSLTSGELVPVMSKLEGTISQRLSVAFEALKQGIDLNATGALKLAEQQKITGQDYKASLRLFQQVQKSLDFSVEETNSLAETLTESSKQYGVSTEFLTASIEKLIQSNEDFLVLNNLGPQFTEAAAMLSAKIGPGLDKDLARVTNLLYTFGSENEAILANLGATSIREQLASNKLTAEQRVALEEQFIKNASARISQISSSSSKSLVSQGDVIKALFGNFAGSIQKLDQQLGKAVERTPESTLTDVTQRILKIFDPIKESFLNFVSTNEGVINALIDGAANFVKMITNIIGPGEVIIAGLILGLAGLASALVPVISLVTPAMAAIGAAVIALIPIFYGVKDIVMQNIDTFKELMSALKPVGNFIVSLISFTFSQLKFLGSALASIGLFFVNLFLPVIKVVGQAFQSLADGIDFLTDKLNSVFGGDAESRRRANENNTSLGTIAGNIQEMNQRGRDAVSQEKALDNAGSIDKIASKYKTLDTYLEAGTKIDALQNKNLQKTTEYKVTAGLGMRTLRGDIPVVSDVRIADLSPEAAKAIANSMDVETLGEIFIRASDNNGRVVADAINKEMERTGFRTE